MKNYEDQNKANKYSVLINTPNNPQHQFQNKNQYVLNVTRYRLLLPDSSLLRSYFSFTVEIVKHK